MKSDFLADTNFLIYLLEGNESIKPFLSYSYSISFISEIELLGFADLSLQEEKKIINLISDSYKIEWNDQIKKHTIFLRRKYKIKLPDAIIAATAIAFDLPFISFDADFTEIKELDFILLKFQ